MVKTKSANKYILQHASGEQVHESFINEDGVECIEVPWNENETLIIKITDPNDPFFEECREELADLPRLNLDETISDLRD